MNAQDLEDKVKDEARAFGLKEEKAANAVLRSNIKSDSFKDGGAYFGYIRPEEAPSQVFTTMCHLWSSLRKREVNASLPWL